MRRASMSSKKRSRPESEVLEDHGVILTAADCDRIRRWADDTMQCKPRARGQGDLFDMPINPAALSLLVGKEKSNLLIGTSRSRQNSIFSGKRPKPKTADSKQRAYMGQSTRAAQAAPDKGIGFRCKATQMLRDERQATVEIGVPSMNVVVMCKGEVFKQHWDDCAVTINVPLTPPGTFTGGRFYCEEEDGSIVYPPMQRGHAYSHLGAVEHGVTEVTNGTRYTLAIHYLPGGCTSQESIALSKVSTWKNKDDRQPGNQSEARLARMRLMNKRYQK